jgi:glycosyltransferase involved in cell wall biosynthesis
MMRSVPPQISVGWIPAHPIYGAISMRRYWQAMSDSVRVNDPFQIRSVIQPRDIQAPAGLLGSALRYWQRQFYYPTKIRREFRGEIGHVLDHSWADMLPHLPTRILKVVTVHDLIPLRFLGELTDAQFVRFQGWVSHIQSADAVIADSGYTKGEVVALLNVPEERIRVVPCGVVVPDSATMLPPLASMPGSLGVFTVGSIGSVISRKNLGVLPEAFTRFVQDSGKKIRLVRVGSRLPVALAEELLGILGKDGLIELGYLSDAEVGQFYQAMDVVVVPSLSEGFGLPVLEALAHGTPVICSNTTSLPEVGGNEAIYFDPTCPEELAARLIQLATFGVTDDWRQRALARAARFSWRASLEGVYSVYEDLLARRDAKSSPPHSTQA